MKLGTGRSRVVSSVKSVVPCRLQSNRIGEKPPRCARGKPPARMARAARMFQNVNEAFVTPATSKQHYSCPPIKITQYRAELPHRCHSYPRHPLREFTPCAPGRSSLSHQSPNPIQRNGYLPRPRDKFSFVPRLAGIRCTFFAVHRPIPHCVRTQAH